MEELIEFDPSIRAALQNVPHKKKRKFLGYLLLLGVQISSHLFDDSNDSYIAIKKFTSKFKLNTEKLRGKKNNSSAIENNLVLLQKEISNLNSKIEQKFCNYV